MSHRHRPRPISSRRGSPHYRASIEVDSAVLEDATSTTRWNRPSRTIPTSTDQPGPSHRPCSICSPIRLDSRAIAYPAREYPIRPGYYMMLGDNSPWSRDGRAWGNSDQIDPDLPGQGWDSSGRQSWEVPEALLIGKAFCVYWPHPKPVWPRLRADDGHAFADSSLRRTNAVDSLSGVRNGPSRGIGRGIAVDPRGKAFSGGPVYSVARPTRNNCGQCGRQQRS